MFGNIFRPRRLVLGMILLLGSLLIPYASAQAAPFLATFRTTAASESITLPLVTGYTYNFTVDWGDATGTSDITSFDDVDRVHTYATAGDYQISIEGQMQYWNFYTVNTSRNQIISLDDDGDVGFGTGVIDFNRMFNGASNLESVSLFDTSVGINFSSMFAYNGQLAAIPLIDTSAGTNFSTMFYEAISLTTIPLLDTSLGTNFYGMFYGASNLSVVPLLNTSSGTNFSSMFRGTALTTIPLLDTSAGTNFSAMFRNVSSLVTVSLLDTSLGIDFSMMFYAANNMTQGALSGTRYTIDYSGKMMGESAVKDVLTNIGTADGAQTLTLTGNPGLASLTAADYSDVLAKGWTVVPAPPVAAPFLATFRTTTASESITLPLVIGYTYNFTVDWGDGTPTSDITTFDDVDRVHTYATAGDHQISIEGQMQYWNFFVVQDSWGKIISLDDAGDVGFGTGVTDFSRMFVACTNLESVALFDTSSGTNFLYMLSNAPSLTTVPLLDTSSGITFTGMFNGADSLTTIPLIDTGNGLDFDNMFSNMDSLTSVPLIDTSSGTDFHYMFLSTPNLTTIPELNTGAGLTFRGMFQTSGVTNIPLINTSSGTSFSAMFLNANSITTIPLLDTGQGTDFSSMFSGATSLGTIPLLNTGSGTYFYGMFQNASSLTSIPSFDTSSGTIFNNMFYGASSLTTIPLLDTGLGTNFRDMFYGASALTAIPLLDTALGTDFNSMFYNATNLTTVPLLNTSSGTNFDNIFYNAISLTEGALSGTRYNINYSDANMAAPAIRDVLTNIGTADGAQTLTLTGNPGVDDLTVDDYAVALGKGWTVEPEYSDPFLATFRTTAPSESITLPLVTGYTSNFTVDWGDGTPTSDITTFDDVDRVHTYVTAGDHQISVTGTMQMWNFFTVQASKDKIISLDDAGDVGFGTGVTDLSRMFENTTNLASVAIFDTSLGSDFSDMFFGARNLITIPEINTANGTIFQRMFARTDNLTSIPLLNTSNGTQFNAMFFQASSLTEIPLLDLGKGTSFNQMFQGASSLTSIPSFNTSLGTNFNQMFSGAESLTAIPLLDTSSGTNFNEMFSGAESLTTIPLLDTSNGTIFNQMFSSTNNLTTIPLLDTSSGTDFSGMFVFATGLTTVPLLDTSKGNNFSYMFRGATSLTTIPLLDVSFGGNFDRMFENTTSLTEGALTGTRYGIDYSSTSMAAPAIQDVFTNIGTADGAQTLTLTGNPGLGDLTAADYADVLAKGWTVVPAPPAGTCSDGIQNQDETGIDCGGATCSACVTASCAPYTSTYFTLLNHYTGIDFSALVSALNGHFYYNCDSREFQYGDATSNFITPPSVGEAIGTAASITLINTNQTAEPDKAYFDSDNAQFKLGQSDGTLLNLTPPARQLDAAGIAGVINAEEGEFYFNTTSGEFYIGNGGGTLDELFVAEVQVETCSDGIINQTETDVDCGGICGATCAMGDSCNLASDCIIDFCGGGVCMSAE